MSASSKVGGQAVIEGVMMRHMNRMAIAVRKPDREIFIHQEILFPAGQKYPLLKLPVLRGMVAFVEALIIGARSLTISANQALPEEEEELTGWQMTLTILASLALGFSLFFFLPTVLVRLLAGNVTAQPLFLNLLEGGVRITIFLSYIIIISRFGDIQRVFQYHGAEHKVISCYEAGEELTVENARKYSSLHSRCGTSFMLLVMAVSILLFSFFGWPGLVQRLLLRFSLLPLVAGISYEIIQLAGRYRFFCYLTAPGLWLQRLTTSEPDDRQLEVAVRALQTVLRQEVEV
ncbi:MAG: DUF1385 domain-containing protein [Firmicutes bacterium]|nr:DUF1385 domain-containing protein [Dethiobacter sp.]MBS3899292.1 DUF1385 domain-containing protein [Dethiobacter sp.]MCL4462716.1 DUF1385 domain-containing protein [Bacillota bacterium]MCL5994407.1 DUF1385 domain-containing protein [Bacillota bacterium]